MRTEGLKSVIDIEASGLSIRSYPIEVGVALDDGTRYEALIKPYDDWTYWDDSAFEMHKISREDLYEHGKSAFDVCLDLNEFCVGKTLYSDCWVLDNSWINQLFYRTGVTKEFRCEPMEYILSEQQIEFYMSCKKFVESAANLPKHRALADASVIQKSLLILENLKPAVNVKTHQLSNFGLVKNRAQVAV